MQKSSAFTDTAEPTVDTDVTMVDVQPPTQPKAFAVSTSTPPTQPKNFNRLPPTGPRVPTAPGPLHLHQPPVPETPPTPVQTQPDPAPAIAGAPVGEGPQVQLPEIGKFTLPERRNSNGKDIFKMLDKTVNYVQSHVALYP